MFVKSGDIHGMLGIFIKSGVGSIEGSAAASGLVSRLSVVPGRQSQHAGILANSKTGSIDPQRFQYSYQT